MNTQSLYYKGIRGIQNLVNKQSYLNGKECRTIFSKKTIYIFGAGVDAEQATKELSEYVSIKAYVDNNRNGRDNCLLGKKIISLEECLEQRDKSQPILVTSYRFALEICEQLESYDLVPGDDFFIWDDMCIFHSDEVTKKYINFLRNIWGSHKKKNRTSIVLLPFDNRHDLMSVIYSYCGNYFAEKNDAVIYGYFRGGSSYKNASPIMKNIYSAFNVESIIDPSMSASQLKEAEKICDELWTNLSTWEDWKNITVYGIHFGTTIVRVFLRTRIPSFDLKDKRMYAFLKNAICTIVFWHHYIYENDIKVVLLADGVSWDGYIRDIAITKGIPVYALCYKMTKATLDFCDRPSYPFFKEMWNQLTPDEQRYGVEWAKEHIEKRLKGGTEEVFYTNKNNFTFAEDRKKLRVLEQNNKIKIVICPHIFEEDCYWCGEQIFDDNYFSWLCHLGELSDKTPNYDWYLKMHPFAQRRDMTIIDMILKKYPRIKKIPADVSPIQLKDEGANFALTVYGTIGHEYPEIGIQVINAGVNPHSSFDFNWNPKTKEEYDNLILHLPDLEEKTDQEGLYQFYSLNYLFYDWEYIPYRTLFFKNPLLAMDGLELQVHGKQLGTWKYEEYMKEWTEEKHEEILSQLAVAFQKLDEWKPNVLYRRKGNLE